MYYVNDVRGNEEHAVEVKDLSGKELALPERFVEAMAGPFQPGEFTDRYREQLESLISYKEPVPTRGTPATGAQ
jgi:non-homologous end joining protein Ku